MSLDLLGAVHEGLLKCPECNSPIKQTENYKADYITINQLGGNPLTLLRGEKVTLVCTSCNWKKQTDNWKDYIKP
ncbi:MAG: hypothetical protein AAB071_04150 [Bacteroidota bacterium]